MKHRGKRQFGIIGMLVILAVLLTGCGNKGKSYYKAAVKSLNKGEYEAAAEEFKKAIELKEDNADYYIDYGFCLTQLGRYEEAKAAFERAILEKDNAIVNKNNKKAYRGLGIMYYLQGDYSKSLKMLKKAMEYSSLNEYDVDILSYMGADNGKLGNYDAALEDLTKVLEEDPKNIAALMVRGEVNFMLGDYENSIKDYLAAKDAGCKKYDLYFGLYSAYTAKGDTVNATAILEEASSLPANKEVTAEDKFYLAKIHYYQGNKEQALEEFKAVSEQGYTESYSFLGDLYLENEDYSSAVYYYELYVKEGTPKDASFYSKLADCYLNVKSYEKALDAVEQGLNYVGDVRNQSLLRNEIICYEHLGDFGTAYTKMETYLSTYPDDEDAKRDLEFLKTRQGKESTKEEESDETSEDIVKP